MITVAHERFVSSRHATAILIQLLVLGMINCNLSNIDPTYENGQAHMFRAGWCVASPLWLGQPQLSARCGISGPSRFQTSDIDEYHPSGLSKALASKGSNNSNSYGMTTAKEGEERSRCIVRSWPSVLASPAVCPPPPTHSVPETCSTKSMADTATANILVRGLHRLLVLTTHPSRPSAGAPPVVSARASPTRSSALGLLVSPCTHTI